MEALASLEKDNLGEKIDPGNVGVGTRLHGICLLHVKKAGSGWNVCLRQRYVVQVRRNAGSSSRIESTCIYAMIHSLSSLFLLIRSDSGNMDVNAWTGVIELECISNYKILNSTP